jgi:hypothetical protein
MGMIELMPRLRMCEGGGVTTLLQQMTMERLSGWSMRDDGTGGRRG